MYWRSSESSKKKKKRKKLPVKYIYIFKPNISQLSSLKTKTETSILRCKPR